MIYTFISSGTDNGKQFRTSEEALAYLHQIAEHSKTHLDGETCRHNLHRNRVYSSYRRV